jgi:hypothetical protein
MARRAERRAPSAVVTLRCVSSLLRRFGPPDPEAPPTGRLGDWYAKPVAARPRHLVLCTNERTLLSVVIPRAPERHLRERFALAAEARLRQIPAPADVLRTEVGALTEVRLGRATSRSVLSSMTHFGHAVGAWLAERGADDLEALGLWLCDTPCFPLATHWPWLEAELLLTGGVAPDRRPVRCRADVI